MDEKYIFSLYIDYIYVYIYIYIYRERERERERGRERKRERVCNHDITQAMRLLSSLF